MASKRYRFGQFSLDPIERRLWRETEPVELTARYLDALILLVREQGSLITKERFIEEVWRGGPVTDEALTQCIKTLRRQLGDSATRPHLIETVPKHGYRFIAPVEWGEDVREGPSAPAVRQPTSFFSWQQVLLLGGAGMIGGGVAGFLGGLCFGFMGAAQSQQHGGLGAFSSLFVLLSVNIPIGMIGGAGVALGIGLAGVAPRRSCLRSVLGGACGGFVVGGVVKLLGMDAFRLLLGRAPGEMTGATEGLLLGAAVGFGLWLASRATEPRLRSGVAWAAAAAGAAGMLVPLIGGRLMGGSLTLLSEAFPESALHLQPLAGLFGVGQFGELLGQLADAGLEGSLFGACVVGAMLSAFRHRDRVLATLDHRSASHQRAGSPRLAADGG